ncbi:MAG: helix-turn-helix domain-containing protein [Caulobacterales bacterium]|nr:helix-turn-helix domain-containing protein [Caulobacterales bacterium]
MDDSSHAAPDAPSANAHLFRSGDPNFMTSLARGIEVISAFSEARKGLRMADLSRITGLSRAVVRRCLHTLRELGYVAEEDGVFQLRPKVLGLGYAYLSSEPLAHAAQPVLARITAAIGETCSIGVLDGDEVIYVARSNSRHLFTTTVTVGSRAPAYCTSMGRAMLAHLPADALARFAGALDLTPRTHRTISTVPALLAEMERVREQGYAVIDEEFELGVRAIAIPVRTRLNEVAGAINIVAPSARFPAAELIARGLPLLEEAAPEIARLLQV